MRIIVDAFGGDNAPLAILQGCEMAVRDYGVDILAVGSEKTIREVCGKNNISLDGKGYACRGGRCRSGKILR